MLKTLLLQNCLAQVLEIWYVALPGGLLPCYLNQDPSVQDGPAPGGRRFELRKTWKYIQHSILSEPHGPDFLNLVCSNA